MESLKTLPVNHPYLSAAFTVAAPLLALLYADYRAYIAMGPHGLPRQPPGLHHAAEDAPDTKATEKIRPGSGEALERAQRSFLLPVSSSGGNSSSSLASVTSSPRSASSRGCATAAMKRDMNAFLDALAAANGEVLLRGLSRLEGTVPAVQAAEGKAAATVTKETRGEILHVHPADGSTHMVLSLADSRRVIETGWGERHRLSGGGFLPWGYTLGEFWVFVFSEPPFLPFSRGSGFLADMYTLENSLCAER
ncbi:hypothetical protein PG993_010192 [Apiospora rasikravindrae]|uniref:Luciferase domain-containing protein n=1 Tax=Apiospora rasikravindrae TaxID=990691 RepID=A0ABR1SLV0_9PEZI